jgi:hypothetical protein
MNQVEPNEDTYFAAYEEVNTVFDNMQLAVMIGEKGKHLTFMPTGDPIDTLEM